MAPDGKLIAFEQRLTEEYIAKLVPNHSRKEDVRNLFGPPYEFLTFPRLERETWTWPDLRPRREQQGRIEEALKVYSSFLSSVFSTLP